MYLKDVQKQRESVKQPQSQERHVDTNTGISGEMHTSTGYLYTGFVQGAITLQQQTEDDTGFDSCTQSYPPSLSSPHQII